MTKKNGTAKAFRFQSSKLIGQLPSRFGLLFSELN